MILGPAGKWQDIECACGCDWMYDGVCRNACEVVAELAQELPVVASLKTFDGGGDQVARGDVVHDHHGIAGGTGHVGKHLSSVLARQTVEEHSCAHDVERSAGLARRKVRLRLDVACRARPVTLGDSQHGAAGVDGRDLKSGLRELRGEQAGTCSNVQGSWRQVGVVWLLPARRRQDR